MPGRLATAFRDGPHLHAVLEHLSPAVSHFSQYIPERAQGSYVWTSDGRKHLDMSTGIGVVSTGHCHPKVVKAIQDQAANMIMAQQNVFLASKPMLGLIERLTNIMPKGLDKFFFANSGSEAVDNAVKIARAHTGRQNIIAFENGFHGRTYGAMSLTTSKASYRANFGPLMPQTFIAPYPYCLHCKARQAAPDGRDWYKLAPNVGPPFEAWNARKCCQGPHEALHWMLKQTSAPSETAAMIIEPILGEGGFLAPPPEYLKTIRQHCDEHGIVMIMDEVQSGVGRTGKWWGHEHFAECRPDMLLFAKGIASGFPMAGVAATGEIYGNLTAGMLGGTYGGSILGCAAANATLDAIEEDGMLENAQQRGMQLTKGLLDLAKDYPIIDVRARGLMVAAEFGGKDGSMTPKYGVASELTKAAMRHDMLLLTAGARETVRFLPPLNISESEVTEALDKLSKALKEVNFG